MAEGDTVGMPCPPSRAMLATADEEQRGPTKATGLWSESATMVAVVMIAAVPQAGSRDVCVSLIVWDGRMAVFALMSFTAPSTAARLFVIECGYMSAT